MKIKIITIVISVIALIAVLGFPLANIYRSSRIVGEIDGARLIYNGKTYIETYESDIKSSSRCLGKAVFVGEDSTVKLYYAQDDKECIVASMFLDRRVYRLEKE